MTAAMSSVRITRDLHGKTFATAVKSPAQYCSARQRQIPMPSPGFLCEAYPPIHRAPLRPQHLSNASTQRAVLLLPSRPRNLDRKRACPTRRSITSIASRSDQCSPRGLPVDSFLRASLRVRNFPPEKTLIASVLAFSANQMSKLSRSFRKAADARTTVDNQTSRADAQRILLHRWKWVFAPRCIRYRTL